MSISKRVKDKRTELGLTQVELAKRVGITQQSLQKIEDGRTQNPRKLLNLAKALHCPADWLLNGQLDEVRETVNDYQNRTERPLLDVAQLIQLDVFKVPFSDAFHFIEAPSHASPNAFWFKVIGDSMSSASGLSVPDNYMVLIEPDLAPQHGHLVLAKLHSAQDITLKQLVIDAGQSYLKPLNAHYLPIPLNPEDKIIGVACEVKRSLIK